MSQKDTKQKDAKPDSSFIQIDDDARDAASAASRPRRRVVVGVLSAACVALIVVSLGFMFPSEGGAWSLSWVPRVFSGESAVAPSSTTVRATKKSAKGKSEAATAKTSASTDDKASEEEKSSESASTDQKTSSSESGDVSSHKKESQQLRSSNQGTTSQGGQGNAQFTGNGGTASGGGGSTQESNQVTVSVSVTSSAVGNPVSAGGTFTFNKGATVYDALCALGVSVNANGTSYGTYVSAIGGLAEKEHGGKSGWMYSVNGSTPMVACSSYRLSNGDKVVWYYVTGD